MEDKNLEMFIPITKIDQERREVWGWAAIEEPDQSQEIMDYQSSKPYFESWTNQAAKRSNGKSVGNVREMHQPHAAGKLIAFKSDDAQKGFFVGARVVDDDAWRKVEEGVYTGFSVGGKYVRRWSDRSTPGLMRYTAQPGELSLVDSPCIPSATFQMVKMASVEVRSFQDGKGELKTPIAVVWEDLEKAVPNAPADGTMPLPESDAVVTPGPKENDLTLHEMPAAQETLVLDPDRIPEQSELERAANLMREDLTDEVAEMLGKIPEIVKATIRDQLALEFAKLNATSAPVERMIRVVNYPEKE